MRRINGGADVESVLLAVAEGVAQAVGFEVAAISYLTRDLHFQVAAVAGSAEARELLLGARVPLSAMESELELAEQWGSLLFIPAERLNGEVLGWIPPEVVPDGDSEPDPDRWRPEDTLRSPLRSPAGELLGLLSVDLPVDGKRPDQARRELLEMYADLAGVALHNARRATELEEQVRLATAVESLHGRAARSLDVQQIIQGTVGEIARTLSADHVWLRAFGDGDSTTGHGARWPNDSAQPASPLLMEAVSRAARNAWATGDVALARLDEDGVVGAAENEPVSLTDRALFPAGPSLASGERIPVAGGAAGWVPRPSTRQDPADPEHRLMADYLRPLGAGTILLAPVGTGPDCLGYLAAVRAAGSGDFSPHEVQAAGQIARNLGQAILNARLLERERILVGQLESLDHYKSDLISTVSHELRTPLTSIAGHLELIEDDPRSATPASFSVIFRNLERVMTLIDDLLTLKKLTDANSPAPTSTVVDLHQAALDAVAAFRPPAEEQGVDLTVVPHGGPLLISGDRDELERVALNLVGNAVKYTRTGGSVTVSTERTDRFVRLVVKDTGMGISKPDQEELFTEFFRTTNPDALALPGTGLGLSIVRRILQRHGGSIRLESELGEGSTFTVRLPLSRTTPR
ncbi:Signal transduction histidine kinase [Nocardioides szechwanensis]|uniref:histidine kinase n=1 Tax=Nocardioides szechwanensis TaxID=1005944 RepID=A0A1G9ZE64_9ACTN|nr:ATP-binding protein [Nocardioides szechwanensis]SDN19682.1 Signal transduction histidine kinase [Nocardioides szechwanensis]